MDAVWLVFFVVWLISLCAVFLCVGCVLLARLGRRVSIRVVACVVVCVVVPYCVCVVELRLRL